MIMKKWKEKKKIVTLKRWLESKLNRRYKNTLAAKKMMVKRKARKKMKR